METIRIGVVGAGANTVAKHIPGLRAIGGVEIVSVCNRSRAWWRRWCHRRIRYASTPPSND
jgi:predicted dehydrogenase